MKGKSGRDATLQANVLCASVTEVKEIELLAGTSLMPLVFTRNKK
jgi:hypothetical protein